jgi:hypothetical protein
MELTCPLRWTADDIYIVDVSTVDCREIDKNLNFWCP